MLTEEDEWEKVSLIYCATRRPRKMFASNAADTCVILPCSDSFKMFRGSKRRDAGFKT